MASDTRASPTPIAVREAIVELGRLVAAARRERRFTQQELAERVGVGRMTIHRLERGAPEVALGTYLTAAWVLGLPVLTFADFAASRHESAVGLYLRRLAEQLPRRVRAAAEEPDDAF